MKPYYQIDVDYAGYGKICLHYEDMEVAVAVIRDMVCRPDVDSAILVRIDDKCPTGFFIICSIWNKSIF